MIMYENCGGNAGSDGKLEVCICVTKVLIGTVHFYIFIEKLIEVSVSFD